MNGVEALLLDVVRDAETPLYSAYRSLGRQIGHEPSLAEYLRMVDRLVRLDILRLWSINHVSQERVRLDEVAPALLQGYSELDSLDASFDPFGLSISLGEAADPGLDPEWRIDLDFEAETFILRGEPGVESRAFEELAKLFPDVRLQERRRRTEISGTVRIEES